MNKQITTTTTISLAGFQWAAQLRRHSTPDACSEGDPIQNRREFLFIFNN